MSAPPLRPVARALVALSRWSLAHPGAVLGLTLLLTTAAVWATTHLRLDTDLKALLPPDYASVTRLERLRDRVGTPYDLIVEVRSPDADANIRMGAAVARALEARPDIRFVVFERDVDVLERHALLFLTPDKLDELRERVKERIRREVRKQLALEEGGDAAGDPADDEAEDDEDDDPFATPRPAATAEGAAAAAGGAGGWSDDDLTLDKARIRERFADYTVPRYLQADEGRILVVKARPDFPTTEVGRTRTLIAETRAAIDALKPASFHPDMEVRLEGHYADMTGQVNTLKDDVLGSSAICLGILLLVVVVYFRRLRPLVYVFVPLVTSISWSLGVAWLVYGALNLVSAFIFAILLGLGIDFGIHMVARYREELLGGKPWREAFLETAATTGVSVFTGATTTALVFFLLTVAHFRGFSQFGVVAGSGVVFSLLAVFTILPALVAVIGSRWPWQPRAAVRRATTGPGPRRGMVRALVGVILLVGWGFAAWSASALDEVAFEVDFGKLGSVKRVNPEDPNRKADFREAVGRVTTGAPAVVMADTPAQAEAIYRTLARVSEASADDQIQASRAQRLEDLPAHLRDLGEVLGMERVRILGAFLSKSLSLYSFVPTDQQAKLPVLADIRRRLEAKRGLFKGKDREDLDEFLAHVPREPMAREQLPAWIRAQFTDLEGGEGRFVILYTRGSKDSYVNAKQLKTALFDLPVGGGVTLPTAANYFVLADVIDTVMADAPTVLVLAFAAILVLVSLQLRRAGDVVLVLLPLAFSLLWLCGWLVLTDHKLNFYNMVLLPLLIGMGVDAGVHLVGRYREIGQPGHLGAILRETGGAVGIATLTTVIGFGGVYYADHIGLNSMGTLAIVGILLTLAGAVLVLPAHLWLLERRPALAPAPDESRAARRVQGDDGDPNDEPPA